MGAQFLVFALRAALLLLVVTVSGGARAAPVLEIKGYSAVYDLAPHTEYLVDSTGALGLSDVRGTERTESFQPLPGKGATFGFADGTHWFKTEIVNRDHWADEWLLVVEYSLLDDVDVWVAYSDGRLKEYHSGDRVAFDTRSFKHRHFNFLFDLPQSEQVSIYVRVASESSLQVPLRLYSKEAFAASTHESQLGIGIYYGILIALLLYNLIIFLSVRDLNYFYYVLYVACFGLVQLALNGLAFEYLWPKHPGWANQAVPLFMALGIIAMAQFSRSFLDLKRNFPLSNRFFLACMLFQCGMIVATFLLPYRTVIVIETGFVFFMALLIVGSGIGCLLKGYRPAAYFLLAWSFVLSGAVIYAMVSFDLLPKNFLTEYGMQIGSAAEMILLSFALAYRINLLTQENERIARESAEMLEYHVTERTRELNEALGELEDANRKLEQHSHVDGLTGVHNRRYLDTALERLWRDAKESSSPLSLLILDLDHFKRVNDEHGHLVGDDVLCDVASLINESVRGTDEVVARYGGEEFFVVMSGADEDTALRRGEELRRRIEHLEVHSGDGILRPTVSIGVATIRPSPSVSVRELVRRADAALYRAKDEGRNRVIAA